MNQGNDSPRLGFSLTTKAVVILSLLLLATSLALGCVLVNQSRGAMKRMLDRRMLDAASAAAHQLDGAAIGRLQAGDSATPAYQAAMAPLRSFQESIALHFIYGIREEPDGSFILTFAPSSTDTGAFGDPIVATDALRSAARGKAAVCAEPYQDKYQLQLKI